MKKISIRTINADTKPIFSLLVWSYHIKKCSQTSTHRIVSSKIRNKRLQCHDWLKKLFWSIYRNDMETYGNIRKIATGQGNYYKTCCLLNYPYFKQNDELIAIDFSKLQVFEANPKLI